MTKENEKPTEAFSFDSLADVHAEIQEKSPDPNDPAIAAHDEISGAQAIINAGQVDSAGVTFDAETHATNREGEPSLTSTGKFRRKKGLSKVLTQTQQMSEAQEKAAARAAGYLCADLTIHSAVMIGGPEWSPVGSKEMSADVEFNEHENLRRAFGDYFEAKGISDFPPGIGLTIALTGYALPRFAGGKETRSRVGKAKTWFGTLFAKLKRKKADAAQSDTRDHRVGQDDVSETASSPVDEKTARGASPRSDV